MRQLSIVKVAGIAAVVVGSGGVIGYQWLNTGLSPALMWVDLSGGIGLITGITGVDTYFASEQRRRFKETRDVIQAYNQDVRPGMLQFMAAYDADISDTEFFTHQQLFENDPDLRAYQRALAKQLDLATVAHALDHMALSVKQRNHLDKQEVLAAITSETSRLLLNPKYQIGIVDVLTDSSMQNLAQLIMILRKGRERDATRDNR